VISPCHFFEQFLAEDIPCSSCTLLPSPGVSHFPEKLSLLSMGITFTFFFPRRIGVWTQGFVLAMKVLCHLSHALASVGNSFRDKTWALNVLLLGCLCFLVLSADRAKKPGRGRAYVPNMHMSVSEIES
jgi:hypothetical protein